MEVIKSDGSSEPFKREKLEHSLRRSGASAEATNEIVGDIEHNMRPGMTTNEIYGHAFALLRKHSAPAAVKYSTRRAILELGPDGFPFEKFVARIFHAWGYETLTDQTVMGGCISHEIDVVAWSEAALAFVEAKYHNEFVLKSDAKVALYIQARREDISEVSYDYGGKKRKVDDFYLITNTKFSDMAIKYGECKGLKMIGWNYPRRGNLHELIEENALHPVTSLSTLSHEQKEDLVGRGVLVCLDIIAKPSVLHDVGVPAESYDAVVAEAQMVIERAK